MERGERNVLVCLVDWVGMRSILEGSYDSLHGPVCMFSSRLSLLSKSLDV